ncbi:hypothetical protein Avbf_05861, partial [Armadillidium vulgare]
MQNILSPNVNCSSVMIDLFELYSNIKDEKSAIHFFQQHNIIPNEKKCINEHWMTITVHRTNLFLWRCPSIYKYYLDDYSS